MIALQMLRPSIQSKHDETRTGCTSFLISVQFYINKRRVSSLCVKSTWLRNRLGALNAKIMWFSVEGRILFLSLIEVWKRLRLSDWVWKRLRLSDWKTMMAWKWSRKWQQLSSDKGVSGHDFWGLFLAISFLQKNSRAWRWKLESKVRANRGQVRDLLAIHSHVDAALSFSSLSLSLRPRAHLDSFAVLSQSHSR